MAIPARDDTFKRAKAPEGRNNLVCVDVWDPGVYKANGDPSDSPDGMVEKQKRVNGVVMGTERKYMVNIVFAVGDRNGQPLRDPETGWIITVSQRFNNTLHDNGYLYKFLKQWLNNKHDLSSQQVTALKADLERPLIGRVGEGSIVHNGDYANLVWVEAVRLENGQYALPPGYTPMQIPSDYVRVQDRAAQRASQEQPQGGGQQRQAQAPSVPENARRADANAFGGDDPFGAAPAARTAQPQAQQAPSSYDDFQAPPFDDDDDLDLPF
jgi:hypothetical protein